MKEKEKSFLLLKMKKKLWCEITTALTSIHAMYESVNDLHGDLLLTNNVTRFIVDTEKLISIWESLHKLQQLEPLNFGSYLFPNGSYQQTETYAVYRACMNLAFYSLIFILMLLQWNSVIPHFWMILCCICMVIDSSMTPVKKKCFQLKPWFIKSIFSSKHKKTYLTLDWFLTQL